jgi:hypothetical protein
MPTVFTNNVNGIIHTDIHYLISEMRKLIDDKAYARKLGSAGRQTALTRFNVRRFTDDWESVFRTVTKTGIYEKTNSLYQ